MFPCIHNFIHYDSQQTYCCETVMWTLDETVPDPPSDAVCVHHSV